MLYVFLLPGCVLPIVRNGLSTLDYENVEHFTADDMLGFATLTPFAGYSIYFPEIFPTRLRGTGVGFCYNTVRYLAAPFPVLLGWLSTQMPFRRVAMIMACIYLVGIVALRRQMLFVFFRRNAPAALDRMARTARVAMMSYWVGSHGN